MSKLLAAFSSLFLSWSVLVVLFAPSALALTREEAVQKLETVLVYVVMKTANGKGSILFAKRPNGDTYVPMFLTKKEAKSYEQKLKAMSPDLKPQMVSLPMNRALEMLEPYRVLKEKANTKLLSPVIISPADMEAAKSLLEKEGIKTSPLVTGKAVPVFFAEPMLTVETSQGPKMVFFMEYSQLKEFAIKSLGKNVLDSGSLKLKVADLNSVVRMIESEDNDIYAIYPNSILIDVMPSVVGEN